MIFLACLGVLFMVSVQNSAPHRCFRSGIGIINARERVYCSSGLARRISDSYLYRLLNVILLPDSDLRFVKIGKHYPELSLDHLALIFKRLPLTQAK